MVRPALDRVEAAAQELAEVGLGRRGFTFVCWMALKSSRGRTVPDQVTSVDVETYCDEWFYVPGAAPWSWFDPFSRRWNAGAETSTNGGWPIGTVWTQSQRNRASARLQKLFELGTAPVIDGVPTMAVEVHTGDDYVAALQRLAGGRQIPLLALALWRYRFGAPAGATDEQSLLDAVAIELRLTDEERAALFSEPAAHASGALVPDADWADEQFAARLPAPVAPPVDPPPGPLVPPLEGDDDYRELELWAMLPLESGDVDVLISDVLSLVEEAGLVLPDPEALVERCVLALLAGHLVLEGPPGTAKTTLARLLAQAFGCRSTLETATADWSTFDVIGGYVPARGSNGQEELRPYLGHVTRTALECGRQVRRHAESPDIEDGSAQAHWLILDELNRAEIDKAVGGLYSVLAGEPVLPLWFADSPARAELHIPRRYRIIGTMNTVDASFVYAFSQGLTRRFGFVYVGVPRDAQTDEELSAALRQAAAWVAATYPGLYPEDATALRQRLATDTRLSDVTALLASLVRGLRHHPDGGWPLGTAQLVDVYKTVVLRAAGTAPSLVPVLDLAVADRVVPQMNGVSPATLRRAKDLLDATGALPRASNAAVLLLSTQSTNYA